jgi:hypothetical protein
MAAKRKSSRRKYGKKAGASVKSAMHRYKRGKLKAGKGSHPKAKSRKQAIAIGLSEAREKGAKVPRKKTGRKRTSKSSSARKKSSTRKKSSSRKSSRKRSSRKSS